MLVYPYLIDTYTIRYAKKSKLAVKASSVRTSINQYLHFHN